MRGLLGFPKLNEVCAEMVDRRSGEVFIWLALFFMLFGYTVEQEVSVFRLERLALLQLRSSLGLRAREWPIKSDPCSSWVGIRCTGGRVTGINISGFRRTRRGSQDPQFSVDALRNLTLLSSFNASNFPLPGSIPEWFGLQVGALEVLDLRSCSINGAIPATLGNLIGLNELYLSRNSLTSIIPLSLTQLTSLSVLDLSQNRLTGQIPSAIATLRNLTLLDLSSNFLSDSIPPVIGTFSGLQFLNLSRNSFSSSVPPELGSLSGLVDLDLSFNSLSGFLPPDFGGLRNMRRLIIGSNFLTGRLPDALWSIQALQVLDVSVNNFTGTLPSATPSPGLNNASASVLNISQNQFYGNITPLISRFTSIDMSGNYFEGLVPIYARGPTSLDRNCLRNSTAQRSLADCVSFYVERNLIFDNFGQPNVSPPPRPGRRRRSAILLASIFGGIGLIVLVLLLIVLLIVWKHKRAHMSPRGVISMEPPAPAGGGNPLPAGPLLDLTNLGDTLTYEKILEATNELNDSNLLRNGHSGDLYRGVLDGGVHIVVKKFDQSSSVKKESYLSELEVFSKVSHARLVPLLGHCLEKEDKKFLVYRHMPNGDLSSSLFRNVGPDGSLQSLDWITRLKIAIGAAEGLSYLHHECNPPLVHRDVQASSILLDDKFEVRLGSLSEVVAQEGDIHRSRITKFLRLPQSSDQAASGTPNSTCAYDVYCFGKVLLELVTGKLGISSPEADPTATKEWLDATLGHISIYDKDLLADILDPSLIIDEDHLEEVWAMAIVARSCLNPRPNRRPIMRYILKALENPLKVVRDEQRTGSDRLRTASSRGSWNATLFGSWRQSSSDVAAHPEAVAGATSGSKVERSSSGKRSRMSGSQGSGLNGDGNSNTNNNGNSSSARKSSKEIFPEPLEEEGVI